MQKSLKSAEQARLVATLVAVRHGSGIRQALAKKLGRPQSFVAIGFIAIARALDADPVKLLRDFVARKPAKAGRRS
jgi:hypothetical protein